MMTCSAISAAIALCATVAFAGLATQPVAARPVAYDLMPDRSSVAFETGFGDQTVSGSIPLEKADLTLDFDRLANCRIMVVLDAGGATTGLPFATEAMRSASVLDAAAYPDMTFRSTSVRAAGDGAQVTGDLTLRGVTRPVTLDAAIWRQQGSAAGDRSRLTVQLTGTIRRSDFGASGYSGLVSDSVRIAITARIVQRE